MNAIDLIVPRYRLDASDIVVLRGVDHVWISSDANGHAFAERDDRERRVGLTHAEYYWMTVKEEAVLLDGVLSPQAAFVAASGSDRPTETRSPKKARKASYYADALDVFLRMEDESKREPRSDGRKVRRTEDSLSWVIPEIQAELDRRDRARQRQAGTEAIVNRVPQPRQFKELLRKYVRSGYSERVLPGENGEGRSTRRRSSFEELDIRRKHQNRVTSANKIPFNALFTDYEAEIASVNLSREADGKPPLKPVGSTAFHNGRREIAKALVLAGQEGDEAALALARIVHRGFDETVPLERVEMDEWQVDLQVILCNLGLWDLLTQAQKDMVSRDRLWMSAAIDVATRAPLAVRLHAEDPSKRTGIALLEMAGMDKSVFAAAAGATSKWIYHGRLRKAVADNGAAFISNDFKQSAREAGIRIVNPPAGFARARPHIERLFRTARDRFLHWFAGRTFSNVIERGDQDPSANASMLLDEVCAAFVRAFVDVYSHTPHEGLAGETPHNMWLRRSREHGILQPLSRWRRRVCFGLPQEATLGETGLLYQYIHYNSPRLQEVRKRLGNVDMKFKVDRFDLSQISVLLDRRWITVDARLPIPPGLALSEWMRAIQLIGDQHAANARIHVSTVLRAVNDLRETGEFAMERAELGSPVMDDARAARFNERLFAGFEIVSIEDETEMDPEAELLFDLAGGKTVFAGAVGGSLVDVPADADTDAPSPKRPRTRKHGKATAAAPAKPQDIYGNRLSGLRFEEDPE